MVILLYRPTENKNNLIVCIFPLNQYISPFLTNIMEHFKKCIFSKHDIFHSPYGPMGGIQCGLSMKWQPMLGCDWLGWQGY